MRVFNQTYTWREIWTLRRSIARALANPTRMVNGARTALAVGLRSQALLGDPVLLLVEPSSRCNLTCGLCPITNTPPAEQGELDLDIYQRVLDELGDSLFFLCLWFYGEPLLHPQLEAMVAQARRRGVMVAVSTNGVALEAPRVQALLDADLDWLFVSLDGATAATHDANRGEGSFDQASSNLRHFIRERYRRGLRKPLVELKPILHRDNEHERDAMLALGRDLGVDRATFQLLTWAHDPTLRARAPRDPRLVLSYPDARSKPHSCARSHSTAVLGWDGTLLPCCEDHGRTMPLGDLAQADFRTAWKGQAWRALRDDQRQHDTRPPLCQRCHIADFERVNLSVPLARWWPERALHRSLDRLRELRSATG